MKKVYLSLALLASFTTLSANNFNMPSWGNNNSNGSNWSMPSMNFGNANNPNNNSSGFNNGSSWNMPSMNWGNGFGNNNNGYGNGSNWSMPPMNWGNGNNSGSNWSMPNFNWNNNNQPFNFGNNGYPRTPSANYYAPKNQANIQYRAPVSPRPPQFIPRLATPKQGQLQQQKNMPKATSAPTQKPQVQLAPQQTVPQTKMKAPMHIPMPSEVKGVILAPENKPK